MKKSRKRKHYLEESSSKSLKGKEMKEVNKEIITKDEKSPTSETFGQQSNNAVKKKRKKKNSSKKNKFKNPDLLNKVNPNTDGNATIDVLRQRLESKHHCLDSSDIKSQEVTDASTKTSKSKDKEIINVSDDLVKSKKKFQRLKKKTKQKETITSVTSIDKSSVTSDIIEQKQMITKPKKSKFDITKLAKVLHKNQHKTSSPSNDGDLEPDSVSSDDEDDNVVKKEIKNTSTSLGPASLRDRMEQKLSSARWVEIFRIAGDYWILNHLIDSLKL